MIWLERRIAASDMSRAGLTFAAMLVTTPHNFQP